MVSSYLLLLKTLFSPTLLLLSYHGITIAPKIYCKWTSLSDRTYRTNLGVCKSKHGLWLVAWAPILVFWFGDWCVGRSGWQIKSLTQNQIEVVFCMFYCDHKFYQLSRLAYNYWPSDLTMTKLKMPSAVCDGGQAIAVYSLK